jgi:hypothetical protein
MKEVYSTEFDDKLKQISIYRKYPQLLPLVGSHYNNQNKRVIFIGESHYLPKESTIHNQPNDWYDSNSSFLSETEKKWINTRKNSGSGKNQKYKPKAYRIYQNIEKGILNSGFNPVVKDNMFRYCSYYNYFQRPAKTGKSLNNTEKDDRVAIETFEMILSFLKFDFAFFVSKKAYNSFQRMKNFISLPQLIVIKSVPHPGSVWWNRKSKKYKNSIGEKVTGREMFESLIVQFEVFK